MDVNKYWVKAGPTSQSTSRSIYVILKLVPTYRDLSIWAENIWAGDRADLLALNGSRSSSRAAANAVRYLRRNLWSSIAWRNLVRNAYEKEGRREGDDEKMRMSVIVGKRKEMNLKKRNGEGGKHCAPARCKMQDAICNMRMYSEWIVRHGIEQHVERVQGFALHVHQRVRLNAALEAHSILVCLHEVLQLAWLYKHLHLHLHLPSSTSIPHILLPQLCILILHMSCTGDWQKVLLHYMQLTSSLYSTSSKFLIISFHLRKIKHADSQSFLNPLRF